MRLTTPFPYRSLIALVAYPTSSYSTKHIGPLIFCLKLIRLKPGLCWKRERSESSR